MKKIFTLLLILGITVPFSGCIAEDHDLLEIAGEQLLIDKNWESFTFKSLTGNGDLIVSRTSNPEDKELSISTSNYTEDLLAIAVFKSDSETSKIAAPYFDKLAQDFHAPDIPMDYAIIFLDIFEDNQNKDISWARVLGNVDSYTNVATACSGGACQKVFLPSFVEPKAGTIYFVNKKDVTQTRKAITWNETEDQENLYKTLKTNLAEYLNSQKGFIDIVVDDSWTVIEHEIVL